MTTRNSHPHTAGAAAEAHASTAMDRYAGPLLLGVDDSERADREGILRALFVDAFIAGANYDADIGRVALLSDNAEDPRAVVRARPGFLRDPDAALVLRGRRMPSAPRVQARPNMMVEIDARRGLDSVVSVFVDGRELSRMLQDLFTLVVWSPR